MAAAVAERLSSLSHHSTGRLSADGAAVLRAALAADLQAEGCHPFRCLETGFEPFRGAIRSARARRRPVVVAQLRIAVRSRMSLRPDEGAGTPVDERVLIAPDEVLESERSSVITGMVVARAWRDPGYRSRLLSSPREILIEEGLEIPDGMAIRAFADTATVRHIHLTSLTTEAEELVRVFREMLPLPEGSEIRLIQNTGQALCLVVPLAPPEPEMLTDTDVLRRLAPRASAFAAGDVIATVVSDAFMEAAGEAAAAAAAAAAVNTTQTETAPPPPSPRSRPRS